MNVSRTEAKGVRWLRGAAAISIRSKLLVACVLLVAVNVGEGVYSQHSQQRIGTLGIEIYDRAFLAMSYLRSSQNGLSKLSADLAATRLNSSLGPLRDSGFSGSAARTFDTLADGILPNVVSDVQVASERAMSPEGAGATRTLAEQLASLGQALKAHDLESSRAKVEQAQAAFDTAVEIYAGDGYVYRRDVQRLIDASYRDAAAAIAAAAGIALTITLVLGASIVPPLRKAVRIAQAISGGQLDSAFPTGGSDETAILMQALSDMRDSLVEKIGQIDALATESQMRAAELSVQNTRFEAALDNMHHGLCMIAPNGHLTVANYRFAEMFGEIRLGIDVSGHPLFAAHDVEEPLEATEELTDGRVIHVASRPVREGGRVVTFEDVTDRRRAEIRLRHMSRHDALTGLPNRVLFREELSSAMEEASPGRGPTLLYIDLDGFKSVNDSFGHGVGDDLLRAAAARLSAQLTPFETIARLGGDEFAVILRTGDQSIAEQRASELVRALQEPFDLLSNRLVIGASVGVAIRRDEGGSDGSDPCARLLKNADVALYRAKAEGKGIYRTYSDALDAAAAERRALEADLRTALDRQELVLLFQPIVRAADGVIVSFEALLRWHHPTRGLIPPAIFIPIAEDTGMITPIGRWVLHNACWEAARWPGDVGVAVNLSPLQFRKGFLVADVRRALSDAQLAPQRLEVEITESVLLQDKDHVIATLMQLRASGVRIALDDFGTGYSSLSYLRKFPFDKLKIDRSFAQNLQDADNAAILQAMVGLGRALDVVVVAEGIETVEQAERLRREGCTEFQGFLFGRPGPAAEVPAVISRLRGGVDDMSRAAG